MSRIGMLVVMGMAIGASAARSDEAWERDIAARLRERVTVSFADTALRDVAATLRTLARVNIVLDDRGAPDARVSLELTDIALGHVLALVEQQCSLRRVLRHGVIVWTLEPQAERVVARVHAVQDMIAPVRDFIGPRLRARPAVATGWCGTVAFCCPEEPRGYVGADELVELVRVDAGAAWDSHPDAQISLVGGRLVVTHTPAVQRRVAQFLSLLRRER